MHTVRRATWLWLGQLVVQLAVQATSQKRNQLLVVQLAEQVTSQKRNQLLAVRLAEQATNKL